MGRDNGIDGRFSVILTAILVVAMTSLACSVRRADLEEVAELPIWVSAGPDDERAAKSGEKKRGPSGAMKALEYWGAQRAYPHPRIPDGSYAEALSSRTARSGFLGSGVEDGVSPWTELGPANVGGRTLALAVDPGDPDLIWAGSASGGLWKTTTGGVGADAWDRVDLGFPALGVGTIALDPADSDVIYVGTGEAYAYQTSDGGEVNRLTRGSYGIGILKSIDGGVSWTHSLDWTYLQNRGVWAIRVHPQNSNIVYAATTEGVYKTTDAGGAWSLVHAVTMAMDLRIHPLNPKIVFAAHGNFGSTGTGIYRSTDDGQNWSQLTNGLPANWTGKAQLGITAGAPVRVYASIANDLSGIGLYRSTDDGLSWSLRNSTNYAAYQGWYSHYVTVSPFAPDTLFAGGIEIWRSTNGGTSLSERTNWQSIFFGTSPPEGPIGASDYAHADHHFAVWHPTDPDTVFFASDGGVFRTTDLGNTFESLIGGYQTTQFYNGFANSGTDPDVAIGGLQDNFTVIYEGTNAWRRVIGGDGTWSAINQSDDSTIYGAAQNLQMFRSYNSGNNFSNITPPNQSGDVTAFVAPYVLGVDQPDVLYAGRARVYRSDNEGSGWSATNGGSPLNPGNPVISLAVADSDADVAYAGVAPVTDRARVYRTRNGGSSWDDVTGSLPDRYPADISIDPNDPDRIFVALMGFGSSHLFKSIDGGDNWIDVGAGLPDLPTSAVAVDPDYPEVIYAGNDFGTHISLDGGSSWHTFDNGMSSAMINDLKVYAPTRKLRAATHGSGAWERDLLGPGDCAGPGEVTGLLLSHSGGPGGSTTLQWSAPLDPGLAPVVYDTISSSVASDFVSGPAASCVESDDGTDTESVDAGSLSSGEIAHYLIRAKSVCDTGSVGNQSSGTPRSAQDC